MDLKEYKGVIFLSLLFIVFSVGGWFWELIYEFLDQGIIANHGYLHGPWLPIYGTGGVLIYLILNRFKKNPVIIFMGSFVFCTLVEYSTAWYLETYKFNKWWDYSHIPFNIKGRTCLLYSTMFGITGLIGVYLIFPFIKKIFNKIELKRIAKFCILFFAIFLLDIFYSYQNPNIVKKYKIINIQRINENRIFKK